MHVRCSVILWWHNPRKTTKMFSYLASEAKKNSTALSPTACRQVELSSRFILVLQILFTFSILPSKQKNGFRVSAGCFICITRGTEPIFLFWILCGRNLQFLAMAVPAKSRKSSPNSPVALKEHLNGYSGRAMQTKTNQRNSNQGAVTILPSCLLLPLFLCRSQNIHNEMLF